MVLDFAVLDGDAAQRIVQLHRLDGSGASLILRGSDQITFMSTNDFI